MSTLNTLLFAFALPKRFSFTGRIYRRAHRAYAYLLSLKGREINMNGAKACFYIFFFAGPVVWTIIALLTLLIP